MTMDNGASRDDYPSMEEMHIKQINNTRFCGACAMQTQQGKITYCRAFGRELFLAQGDNLPVKTLYTTVIAKCEECLDG